MQPGYPGQDPYGQNPSGQQPPPDPNAPQYQDPYAQQPYGQPAQGQPYGQPAYPGPVPGQGRQNTMGLVGMILGIVALPLSICWAALGVLLGIAAIVLGSMGGKKVDQGLADNRGQAKTALICGIIAVALGIINMIFVR
ncbi:MAG TPA: hypothetical protein VF174_13820 [Micromonosporaceae bacterium]